MRDAEGNTISKFMEYAVATVSKFVLILPFTLF